MIYTYHLLIRLRRPFIVIPLYPSFGKHLSVVCTLVECCMNTCPTREGRRNPLDFGICEECWVNTCPTCESRRNPLGFGICERVESVSSQNAL